MVAILEGRLPDILTVVVLELSDCLYSSIIENPYGISALYTLKGVEQVDEFICGDRLVACSSHTHFSGCKDAGRL